MKLKISAKNIENQMVADKIDVTINGDRSVAPSSKSSSVNRPPSVSARELEFIDELARVFTDGERAAVLLSRAGFPNSHLPAFSTPLSFWTKVVEEIRCGAPPGDTVLLAEAAVELYPNSTTFGRYHHHSG